MSFVTVELDDNPAMTDAFSALLEESFQKSLTPGSVVVGEIISIEKDFLIMDIGGKCEGHVPFKELPGNPGLEQILEDYKPGQILEVFINKEFDEDKPFMLSMKRVGMVKDWEELARLQQANQLIQVTVCGTTRGGVLVQAMALKGFIPASQLRIAKTLDELVGDSIPVKILEVDKSKNKLIFSHRAAIFEAQAEQRLSTINGLEEGQIVEGEVVKITNFGAFIDIDGIDGLLPLSEISWRRIKHPSDMLNLGDKLTVQVLTIDKAQQRISLSMKRLSVDPWETVQERFKQGEFVTGQISKLLNSGFLAELEPGIEAFCSYHQVDRDSLVLGENSPFKIISIAAFDRRITLEPANN